MKKFTLYDESKTSVASDSTLKNTDMQDLIFSMTRRELETLVIDCVKVCLKHHEPTHAAAAPPPARILTTNEAAALVGLAKATLYKLTSAGQIPHSKRGKKLYFERDALEAWLTQNRVQPDAANDRAAERIVSGKNARIREHLAATCEDHRSKNCFRFGAVEIKIDHDSPLKGVEFREYIRVSVYDRETGVEMIFAAPVSEVDFLEPTFSGE